jgi:predicted ABC-type ATPase
MPDIHSPNLIIIAGPNGAGKSTTAPALLRGTLSVSEFVNADMIAQGLSAFRPDLTAFQAGRIMLARLRTLAGKQVNFAFETTLASKTFAPWISDLRNSGYKFNLVFLYLPDENFAVERVSDRVRMGGHDVPESTIKRRYHAGLRNFFHLYCDLADTWYFYDNSGTGPKLIAHKDHKNCIIVNNSSIWHTIKERYGRQ